MASPVLKTNVKYIPTAQLRQWRQTVKRAMLHWTSQKWADWLQAATDELILRRKVDAAMKLYHETRRTS